MLHKQEGCSRRLELPKFNCQHPLQRAESLSSAHRYPEGRQNATNPSRCYWKQAQGATGSLFKQKRCLCRSEISHLGRCGSKLTAFCLPLPGTHTKPLPSTALQSAFHREPHATCHIGWTRSAKCIYLHLISSERAKGEREPPLPTQTAPGGAQGRADSLTQPYKTARHLLRSLNADLSQTSCTLK